MLIGALSVTWAGWTVRPRGGSPQPDLTVKGPTSSCTSTWRCKRAARNMKRRLMTQSCSDVSHSSLT